MEELARALAMAFATGAHAAEPRFEVVVAGHDGAIRGWKSPTMRASVKAENRCRPQWLKTAVSRATGTVESTMALPSASQKTMCKNGRASCRKRGCQYV